MFVPFSLDSNRNYHVPIFSIGNSHNIIGTYDINDESAHIKRNSHKPRTRNTTRTRIVGDIHNKGNTHVHSSSIDTSNVSTPICEHSPISLLSQLPLLPTQIKLKILSILKGFKRG